MASFAPAIGSVRGWADGPSGHAGGRRLEGAGRSKTAGTSPQKSARYPSMRFSAWSEMVPGKAMKTWQPPG